jgi:hypothetical protein
MPRFPSIGIEKEFAQLAAAQSTAGLSDRQVLHQVLSRPEHRYLARELTWVLAVQGVETFLLVPPSDAELDQLIAALQPRDGEHLETVLGLQGPMVEEIGLAGVHLTRVYSFALNELIASLEKPENASDESFRDAVQELLDAVLQMAENAGNSDDYRAVNYLAMRYPAIYSLIVDRFAKQQSLVDLDVQDSRLAGRRAIKDVILTFIDRRTQVLQKFFTRVDVTELFPFLVSGLQPYFNR